MRRRRVPRSCEAKFDIENGWNITFSDTTVAHEDELRLPSVRKMVPMVFRTIKVIRALM